ncbi:DUF1700 domain-containing protein [Loigolactobacillus rennini]|uniref:Putative integral membrane protein (Putative) n=1 Tax=Loigolactobacillus rennini DSM 20253 TaxID=1423796 RepID=A0A0R2D5X4_9LACO|nr:DUF1700 domain-containing protein [Loigolactobacillus rennini]KRM99368.1 putative integral membrane protein (putative) [Loigolactobacillus rennini DSM 20253]
MTTQAYLDKFAHLLKELSPDELNDVLEYYQEYILDAGLPDYTAVVQQLGTPQQLARKTLADYSIQRTQVSKASPRHNAHLIWLILLALFASPIALPLAAVVLAFLVAGIAVVIAIIFTAIMLVAALFLAGGFLLIAGIAVLFQSFITGIFYIGTGLIGLGAGALGLLFSYLIVKLLLQWGAALIKHIYRKVRTPKRKGANH